MRIFKYWKKYTVHLKINDEALEASTFGGSNISEEETKYDAVKKFESIQRKINGERLNKEEYEADILEEIIHEIDSENIITRNRYGALVLNSTNLMFIDIDTYSYSLIDVFFRLKKSKKELMLAKIEKTIKKTKYRNFSFRIYETKNGFRVLIPDNKLLANSKETDKIMRDFRVDWLYLWLCQKQNCYRARLTPKPFRIKQKAIKVQFPDRTQEQEITLANWIHDYDNKSNDFATCRLVETYGDSFHHKAISYHDRMTKINYEDLRLA